MLLAPRYDGPAVLRLDLALDDPAVPLLRQRRRLGERLAALDDDQWATPSRCDGWSVRDVVAHLVTTNQFWTMSATAGLAGEPTRFLATFDPVATPAQLVAGNAATASEVLDEYRATTESLAQVVTDLDPQAWSTPAEAPPGHIELDAVMAHALWDAWVHERDALLPLGLIPPEEPDELAMSLAYAVALGPALAITRGRRRSGRLAVQATDPQHNLVVNIGTDAVVVTEDEAPAGTPALSGSAVALLEGLSFRAPLEHGLDDADHWLLEGLDETFDRTA